MIKSFRPFLAVEDSYDGNRYRFTFRCPHCGSTSAIKLGDLDKTCFWSGQYMCAQCGKSQHQGKQFNYYHDCFTRHTEPTAVQLSLF